VNLGRPEGSLDCSEFLVDLYNDVITLKDGFSMDSIGTHSMENPLPMKIRLAQNPKHTDY
jgi:hypothetical protein